MCDVVRPIPAEMFNEYGEYTGHYCNIAIANKDQMSLYNKEELQLKVRFMESRGWGDILGWCSAWKGRDLGEGIPWGGVLHMKGGVWELLLCDFLQ